MNGNLKMSTSNLRMIKTLELELNSACNLKCELCFRKIDKTRDRACKIDELLNKLENYKDLESVTIAGQRSEPTLYKDLFKLIGYLNKRKINVLIYTNAETHDDLYFKKLALLMSLNHHNKIVFSIFGSTQELHQKYRVGSKLENVIRRYDICDKLCNCEINWVVFKYNLNDYKLNKDKFKPRNVISFLTLPFFETFKYKTSDGICLPDEVSSLIRKFSKIHDGNCTSVNESSAILDCNLNEYKCFLEKYFGTKYCYFCNKSNLKISREFKLLNLPEFSGDEVEIPFDKL